MDVNETLDRIENLVVDAKHFPLTGKSIIDENDLIHLVDELRQELPLALEHAERVMADRDKLIEDARTEADNIINQAKGYADKLVDEHEIVRQAREKADAILNQAQGQERDIMERTQKNSQQMRDDADNYANQVLDQLIAHVTNTFQGVQQAEQGLQQARNTLQQAKAQMNQNSQAERMRATQSPPRQLDD